MPIEVPGRFEIPDAELTWRFSPSGGPGGQHANRAHSRVDLMWDLAGSTVVSPGERGRLVEAFGDRVRVVVDEERSQARNRDIAAARLAARVAGALRPVRTRRPTKPSRRARQRRLDDKRRAGRTKQLRRRPGRDD